MKPRIKKFVYLLSSIALIAAFITAGLFIRIHYLESRLHPVTMPFSEMEKIPICVDRIFPLSDLEKSFGFSDYVFIGTVEEIIGTEYNDISMHRFTLYEDLPETHFHVKSIRNIKGSVPEEVTLKTYGGQQPDGRLEEMHPMSENKSTYLFMCIENEGEMYYFNCEYIGKYDWLTNGKDVNAVIEYYEDILQNQDLSVKSLINIK